jgi:hypothetical protein
MKKLSTFEAAAIATLISVTPGLALADSTETVGIYCKFYEHFVRTINEEITNPKPGIETFMNNVALTQKSSICKVWGEDSH